MSVALHTSALAASAHEAVFLPWLKEAAALACRERGVVAVVVPFRTDAYHLKARALSAGIGLLGVQFLTPGELRERLAAHLAIPARVPIREHMHLLLATAAERVAERRGGSVPGLATAPDQVLKAMDLIGDGGWDFAEAGPPQLQAIVAEFGRLLHAAGFSTRHETDRALLAAAPAGPPLFAQLFLTGFNAMHWPLWPLLEASVRAAATTTVCLTDPRLEGEDLDAAWIGTWEETFGAASPVASDFTAPFSDLLRAPENSAEREARAAAPAPEIAFLVGHDTAGQARAVAAQALHFLADPACGRLGVLFPAADALSRHVAALLADFDVPHQDGLAHPAPGALEDAVWPAWLELQENPRLPALLHFLRTQSDGQFVGLTPDRASDELQRVYQDLLLDDLGVLADYLARHSSRKFAPALAEALRAIPFLPRHAPLSEMIARTETIFHDLGWQERADELVRLAEDWRGARQLDVSRRAWLHWLGETLVSWKTERAPAGAHPYSRLHLLPYAQAESQTWTHLIAAGLNEGEWPPSLEDAGFLGEDEIAALNRRLRTLNTRATTQGRQGEGHVVVQPGKAFCLGPAQRRALAARQFYNTLESATVALALTAQLHDEAAPDRHFNPGEFFAQLYFCTRGRAIAQETMAALHGETERWLRASGLWKRAAPDLASVRSTRRAYDARRASGEKFGVYEFALSKPPQPPLRLAAKRWEEALKVPAAVWLASVLGVASREGDDETPWSLAQGNWVHDWLRTITGSAPAQSFAPLPAPAELHARILAAATRFRERISAILAAHHRPVPDWWASAWEQALGVATLLGQRVAQIEGRPHAATEWDFGDTEIQLEAGTLHIRGRIDLLLGTAPSIEDTLLVDYKTGSRTPLSSADLARGDSVQLALYALALRAAGARAVSLSLLSPGIESAAPQLTLADLDLLPGLWRGLWQMQESGVFGMSGPLRDEYLFRADYPLATLAIDEEILAGKWTATHREFGEAGES